MEMANVNVLGVTKGTVVEEAAMANFRGETHDEAHDLFNGSSRDEARHAMMLNGLKERFFK